MKRLADFREVWFVDFEFRAPPGHRPDPICMVASEYHSGVTKRLWHDELRIKSAAPFSTGRDALLVAYYASAELGCFLTLDWPLPECVLDLYVEFRCLTNGRPAPAGNGLLGALAWFGLDTLSSAEKEDMRELATRGGPFSAHERAALLEYCESDVRALPRLLGNMAEGLDLPRALLRGRYVKAAAQAYSSATKPVLSMDASSIIVTT